MISVVGSANIDLVAILKRLPKRGETLIAESLNIFPGGKGANQAVGIAKLAEEVAFIARIGKDTFGTRLVKNLDKRRVNTRYIVRDKIHPSGMALIFVNSCGDNIISVAPGSNAFLEVRDILKAQNVIKKSRVLLLQLEIPLLAVRKAVEIAHRTGCKVILNPAPIKKLDKKLLERVDILTPNETELEALTGRKIKDISSACRTAKRLLKKGIGAIIVTMGRRGALLVEKKSCQRFPAPEVKVVDTTAAGDSFNAALAVAISRGKDLRDAIHFANCAGALAVTKLGAQPSLPTKKELNKFLRKENRKI